MSCFYDEVIHGWDLLHHKSKTTKPSPVLDFIKYKTENESNQKYEMMLENYELNNYNGDSAITNSSKII